MAHFVKINDFGRVVQVLVVDDNDTRNSAGDEIESIGAEYLSSGFGGTWKRTSYNTYAGKHKRGGTPYRKNYAGTGYTFDESRDAFIPPKKFDSWTLNEDTCQWDAPKPYPDDGKNYSWNENGKKWTPI